MPSTRAAPPSCGSGSRKPGGAYQAYREPDLEIAFWRTSSGHEVDFILGDMQVAIEIKASSRVHEGDLRGLRTLAEESRVRQALIVCLERQPRRVAPAIEAVPWRAFIERLWAGDLGV